MGRKTSAPLGLLREVYVTYKRGAEKASTVFSTAEFIDAARDAELYPPDWGAKGNGEKVNSWIRHQRGLIFDRAPKPDSAASGGHAGLPSPPIRWALDPVFPGGAGEAELYMAGTLQPTHEHVEALVTACFSTWVPWQQIAAAFGDGAGRFAARICGGAKAATNTPLARRSLMARFAGVCGDVEVSAESIVSVVLRVFPETGTCRLPHVPGPRPAGCDRPGTDNPGCEITGMAAAAYAASAASAAVFPAAGGMFGFPSRVPRAWPPPGEDRRGKADHQPRGVTPQREAALEHLRAVGLELTHGKAAAALMADVLTDDALAVILMYVKNPRLQDLGMTDDEINRDHQAVAEAGIKYSVLSGQIQHAQFKKGSDGVGSYQRRNDARWLRDTLDRQGLNSAFR
jgi:hypothetical protein